MNEPRRLAELLPAIHRQRDAAGAAGGRGPLESLLDLLDEQVDELRRDIGRLYDNWFVETAEPWALAHLAELIDVDPGGATGTVPLAPSRAWIANGVRSQRRKGTLAVLEEAVEDATGWAAAVSEPGRLVVAAPNVRHVPAIGPGTAEGGAAPAPGTHTRPFDRTPRTMAARRSAPLATAIQYGPRSVAVHLWRLPVGRHDRARAGRREEAHAGARSFTLLGNDVAAVVQPGPAAGRSTPSGPFDVPTPITRRWLAADLAGHSLLYGPDRSLQIWTVGEGGLDPIPASRMVAADLSDWRHRPPPGRIAIDPELGRLTAGDDLDTTELFVTYSALVDDIGAVPIERNSWARVGCVDRPVGTSPGPACLRYRVATGGLDGAFPSIAAALDAVAEDNEPAPGNGNGDDGSTPRRAVVEIEGAEWYPAPAQLRVPAGVRLELVGVGGSPLLWLTDVSPADPDPLVVIGEGPGSCLVLDNVIVAGRGLVVRGELDGLVVHRSTLVPGWQLGPGCEPVQPGEASIRVVEGEPCVRVEHSVVGPIQVSVSAVDRPPLAVSIDDSIVDGDRGAAIGAGGPGIGHLRLTLRRSTVLGSVTVHEVDLVSDAIVTGGLFVARRQVGCVRFSYLSPGCRPPRRFQTQPGAGDQRPGVEPVFVSERFGRVGYGRLSPCTADEISRGAHDGSEMGAFHHLHEPQRLDAARRQVAELSVTGADVALVFEDLEEQ